MLTTSPIFLYEFEKMYVDDEMLQDVQDNNVVQALQRGTQSVFTGVGNAGKAIISIPGKIGDGIERWGNRIDAFNNNFNRLNNTLETGVNSAQQFLDKNGDQLVQIGQNATKAMNDFNGLLTTTRDQYGPQVADFIEKQGPEFAKAVQSGAISLDKLAGTLQNVTKDGGIAQQLTNQIAPVVDRLATTGEKFADMGERIVNKGMETGEKIAVAYQPTVQQGIQAASDTAAEFKPVIQQGLGDAKDVAQQTLNVADRAVNVGDRAVGVANNVTQQPPQVTVTSQVDAGSNASVPQPQNSESLTPFEKAAVLGIGGTSLLGGGMLLGNRLAQLKRLRGER